MPIDHKKDESIQPDSQFLNETPEDSQESAAEEELVSVKDTPEYQELNNKYLRLLAEFENAKKRNARERIELIGSAAKDTLLALLPVLDDFDRAERAATTSDNAEDALTEGVQLVYNKLYRTLGQLGLQPMHTEGADFDPDLHEALTELPVAEAQKGKIVDTIEKGYTLHDKIIRHAKVVVGK